jgi:ABC-type Mn2+/Zn2+ transport system permease subunit
MPRFKWRPLVVVLGSVVLFGAIVRTVGVALSTVLLIVTASAASHEFRPRESLIAGVLLAALAVGVFVIGLQLQLPIWPWQR